MKAGRPHEETDHHGKNETFTYLEQKEAYTYTFISHHVYSRSHFILYTTRIKDWVVRGWTRQGVDAKVDAKTIRSSSDRSDQIRSSSDRSDQIRSDQHTSDRLDQIIIGQITSDQHQSDRSDQIIIL